MTQTSDIIAFRPTEWLENLGPGADVSDVDGLVSVADYDRARMRPEEVAIMEKAAHYGAQFVFFEAPRNDRPSVPQAFVFVSDSPGDQQAFADLHKRLWSWGGVPLLYRKTRGRIDLFRCAAKADFDQKTEVPKYKPFQWLNIASDITASPKMADPWWDVGRLRNGTLWDDPEVCKKLLSSDMAAHRHLVRNIEALSTECSQEGILSEPLWRRMLILSLLTAYLDERGALGPCFFADSLEGAEKFVDVLRNGDALVKMLKKLEDRFNGHVFELDEKQRDELLTSQHLDSFADLIEGHHDANGQGNFWRLYSFRDLPVELISNIYQLFVEERSYAVYTPPPLVRLMLDEALSWDRLDLLMATDQIICDPACGSGVFLVEAYKRLVLHWRSRNDWAEPGEDDLKRLQLRVQGSDKEDGAIKLAAFSLCLAMCEALNPEDIRKDIWRFQKLQDVTLHCICFFEALENRKFEQPVGVMIGNPPFTSSLNSAAAEKAALELSKKIGKKLPDKQLAYLFLHKGMEIVANGGVLSMIEPAGFLYNLKALPVRESFFEQWDVREILDFVSVRGMFAADPKIVVVVAEAKNPPPDRKVLHAVFRRSGRAEAEQGFEIDYYDLHWLPRQLAAKAGGHWRANLFGGGRVLSFVERLSKMRTLRKYADQPGWKFGQGFIAGKMGLGGKPDHIVGKPLLCTEALTASGLDLDEYPIGVVPDIPIKDPSSEALFTPPFLLIKAHENFYKYLWNGHYLTFKDKLLAIAAPKQDIQKLKDLENWLTSNSSALRAYSAATSISSVTRKATALANYDVKELPYPEGGHLDLSEAEKIIADDILNFHRDLLKLGQKSRVMTESGEEALAAFNETFAAPINAIYSDNPLVAHPPQSWPGIICQPYSFGDAEINWTESDSLREKLDGLLREQRNSSLSVTRIARIYDGNCLFLIKPDRLRFWLRSIALRDADDVLADLRAQGF